MMQCDCRLFKVLLKIADIVPFTLSFAIEIACVHGKRLSYVGRAKGARCWGTRKARGVHA